jgi:hypothetical protein
MDPKKFLFITHLTPAAKRSETRAGLLRLMQQSLEDQTYIHWKSLRIGEEEFDNGKIKIVNRFSVKTLFDLYAREDLKALIDWADYIVKVDDDDIVLPHTLELASQLEFDCYCDRFHTFYDFSTGRTTQQSRSWIAATCIHKKEHAITLNKGTSIAENFSQSLFYGEHGVDWIAYYHSKKIVYAHPTTPVYVRILSPTSQSAGAKIYPVSSTRDADMNAYRNYVRRFGSWNYYPIRNWSAYPAQLKILWERFSSSDFLIPERTSRTLQMKEFARYWVFRITGIRRQPMS